MTSNAAVYASSSNQSNTITNYGTIAGVANGIYALGSTTLVNYGVIIGGAGFNAINLANAQSSSAIFLKDGSYVSGNVKAASSGTLPPLTLEGSGSITGTVSGVSTLTMAGTDWSLGGASTAADVSLQSGVLRIANTLTGTVQMSAGATLAGTGTVGGSLTVPSGATILPGASGTPGTLSVSGAYTQSSGGTLSIATTPSAASKLAVTGAATLDGTLAVVSSGNGYTLPTQYTILTAGSVSGSFSTVTESDPTLTPTLTYDSANNQVLLTLTQTVSPPPPPPPPPPSPPVSPPTPPVVVTPSPPVVVSPPVVSPPPPPVTGVIDTSRTNFTNGDGAVQAATVTFDGGTLRPSAPLTLSQPVDVTGNSGVIAPGGSSVLLTGAITGSGALTVSETGTVTVAGSVSNSGGLAVRNGGNLVVADTGRVSVPVTVAEGSNATIAGISSGPLTVTGAGSLTLAGSGIVTGALTVSGGSAVVGGVVGAPVTLSGGGAMTVIGGGGVGGTVTVSGATLRVAANGIVNGAVTLGDGGSATVAGAIMAPVTVQNAVLAVEGTGSTGSVVVGSGGAARIDGTAGGTVAIAEGATLGGNGVIRGATTVAGTLSPGNSPGVLTVGSAVTMTGTGIYRAEVDGPSAGVGAGHHDQVAVQGATFTAAGTLAPVLRGIGGSATNSYLPALGQSFSIVTASGGVLGSFGSLVQPTDGLGANTRFDALYDATAVRLVVTPGSYAALGGTGNQRAAGAAVDAIRPAAGTRLDGATAPVFSGLYGLNGAQTAGALDRLSGQVHADALAANLASRRLFGQAVTGRLAALREGAARGAARGTEGGGLQVAAGNGGAMAVGTSSGRADHAGAGGVWGQPLAGYGRVGADGTGAGMTQRIGGFLVGADHAYDGGFSAGVALGYLRGRVSSRGELGKADTDSYQATLYGAWQPGGNGSYVEGAVGYGYAHYDTERTIAFGSFGQAASGKAHGHDLSAELAAGRRLAVAGDAWIEPRAGLRLDRITRGGFAEEGGAAALSVEASAWTSVSSSIGLRTGTTMALGGWTLRPTASAAWVHDFADVTANSSNRLSGVAFTAQSANPGRDAVQLGAGFAVELDKGLTAGVTVQDEVRAHANSVSATAGLRWKL
ncbi:autotransporter domain-containing protein [Azospirillum sp. A29]|uniref:autotransporter domain-containing protein n=1 Tax=Azospirillum sp. A29 TaxID=3160606 RepID=UPI00366CF113